LSVSKNARHRSRELPSTQANGSGWYETMYAIIRFFLERGSSSMRAILFIRKIYYFAGNRSKGRDLPERKRHRTGLALLCRRWGLWLEFNRRSFGHGGDS